MTSKGMPWRGVTVTFGAFILGTFVLGMIDPRIVSSSEGPELTRMELAIDMVPWLVYSAALLCPPVIAAANSRIFLIMLIALVAGACRQYYVAVLFILPAFGDCRACEDHYVLLVSMTAFLILPPSLGVYLLVGERRAIGSLFSFPTVVGRS